MLILDLHNVSLTCRYSCVRCSLHSYDSYTTVVLQLYYGYATVVLQPCCSRAAAALQPCYRRAKRFFVIKNVREIAVLLKNR